MLVSSPQPGAYGTNLFSTFPCSLSLFLLPIPLMISTMLSPAASTYPSYHFIFAILKSFLPLPSSYFLFLGGAMPSPPPPSSFFSFFLSATGPFNFGGEAYRLPGKKRAVGRREGDGGREKPGRQRCAWLMSFKRGSLACQIAGCGEKNGLAYLFGLPRDVMQHSFIFLDKTQ